MPSSRPPEPEAPIRVAALILAAGGSARMGTPKQLLTFRGVPLVRHAANTALAARLDPVIVILGAHAEAIESALSGLAIQVVRHAHWARGIGTSIRAGVAALPTWVDAAIVMLSDQPLVTPEHLMGIVAERRVSAASIVATAYSGSLGVPALFARSRFIDLAAIEDHAGAKSIIQHAKPAAHSIPFPDAGVDVDTPDDVRALRSR